MIEEQGDVYSIIYSDDGEIDNSELKISNSFKINLKSNTALKLMRKLRILKFYKFSFLLACKNLYMFDKRYV